MPTANVRLGRAFIDFIARDQSLVAGVRRSGQALRRHRQAVRNTGRSYSALTKSAQNFRMAVLGGNGALLATVGISAGLVGVVRHFIELSDQSVLLGARLRLVAKSASDYQAAFSGIRSIAREVRVPIAGLIDLTQRFGRASRRSAESLLPLVRGLAQAGVISGATSQEIRNGLIQLAQGIAANRLGGDELRAVFEQIPRVAQAIADGLGVTIGFLRDISKEGGLTTEVVLRGLERSLPQIEEEFANIPITVGRAIVDVNNEIFNLVGSLNSVTGITSTLVRGIESARDAIRSQRTFDALSRTITILARGFAFLLNNLDLVGHAIAAFAVLAVLRSPLGRLGRDITQLIFSLRSLSAGYQAVGRAASSIRGVFVGTRGEIARLQVRVRQLRRSWLGYVHVSTRVLLATQRVGAALRVGLAGGAAAAAVAIRGVALAMRGLVAAFRVFSGLILIEGLLFAISLFRNLSKEAERAGVTIQALVGRGASLAFDGLAIVALRAVIGVRDVFVLLWDSILNGFSRLWREVVTDLQNINLRQTISDIIFENPGEVERRRQAAARAQARAASTQVGPLSPSQVEGVTNQSRSFIGRVFQGLDEEYEKQVQAFQARISADDKITKAFVNSFGTTVADFRSLFDTRTTSGPERGEGSQSGELIQTRKESIRLAKLEVQAQIKGADTITQAQIQVNRAFLETEQRLKNQIALLGRNRREALILRELQSAQAPFLKSVLDTQTKIEGKERQILNTQKAIQELIAGGETQAGYDLRLGASREVLSEYQNELKLLKEIQAQTQQNLSLTQQVPPNITALIDQRIAGEADRRAGQEARRRVRQLVRDTNTPLQEYRRNIDAVNRAWKDTTLNLTSVEVAQARVAAQLQFIRNSGREIKGVMDQAAAALQNVGSIGGGAFEKILNAISQTISLVKNLSDLFNSLSQLLIKLSGGAPSGGFLGGLTGLLTRLGTLGTAGAPPAPGTPATGMPATAAASAAVSVAGPATVTTVGATTVNAAGTVSASGAVRATGPITLGGAGLDFKAICECIMESGRGTLSALGEQTVALSADIQNNTSQIIATLQSIATQERTAGLLSGLGQAASVLGAQGRQFGGPVRRGRPYLVGEGGVPELFFPRTNGFIVPRESLRSQQGGNFLQQTFNFQGSRQDIQPFMQQVLPAAMEQGNELLRRNTRRASPERNALREVGSL